MITREIVYGLAETNFGQILIAECLHSHSVVAVYFVNDDLDYQMVELRDAYSTAELCEGNPTQTSEVVRAINGLDTSVHIDIRQRSETPFTVQVYEAIRQIPKGETRSYSQIAVAIGNPSAARAVAGACARNNLAYIIPCHRVISSTGTVSGYRWGVDKKRALLRAEGVELNFRAM